MLTSSAATPGRVRDGADVAPASAALGQFGGPHDVGFAVRPLRCSWAEET